MPAGEKDPRRDFVESLNWLVIGAGVIALAIWMVLDSRGAAVPYAVAGALGGTVLAVVIVCRLRRELNAELRRRQREALAPVSLLEWLTMFVPGIGYVVALVGYGIVTWPWPGPASSGAVFLSLFGGFGIWPLTVWWGKLRTALRG